MSARLVATVGSVREDKETRPRKVRGRAQD